MWFVQSAFQTQLSDPKLFTLAKPQFQHLFSLLSCVKRHNYTIISLTNFLFLSIYVIFSGFPPISSGRALPPSLLLSLPCTCVNYIYFKWLFWVQMITCVKEPGYVAYVHMLILKKNMHLFSCNTYPLQKNGEQTDKRHPTLTVQERSVHALLAISLAFILPE